MSHTNPTALLLNATSPLGQHLTQHLLSKSYTLILADRNAAQLHTLSATWGSDTTFLHYDPSSWASVSSLFNTAASSLAYKIPEGGPTQRSIDSVVILPLDEGNSFSGDGGDVGNSALLNEMLVPEERREHNGASWERLRTREPDTSFLKEMEAVVWATKAFVRCLGRGPEGGKLIIFGEGAELSALPECQPVYGGGACALVGLTRSLGPSLKLAANVSLNCILPAFVNESMASSSEKKTVASMSNIMKAVDILLGIDEGTDKRSDKQLEGRSQSSEARPSSRSGQILEVGMKGLHWRRQADWPDEEQRWMGEERAAFFERLHARI